jgi:ATP-binding cassette subfamily F protein uup
MTYLKEFLFTSEQARSPVRALSGGERGRLALAVALARPSNLLVLDEPTNDLDLETLDLLEETLADYAGTALLVSHDRDFLDRLATSVLAPDPAASGSGRWLEYAGGYSDMIAQQRAAGVPPLAERLGAMKPAGVQTVGSSSVDGASGSRKPAAERAKPAPRARLTFKDQHALQTLPGEIETLGRKIAELSAAIAEPALYAKDRPRFDRLTAELTAAQTALAAAEERWLELEMKREEMERG